MHVAYVRELSEVPPNALAATLGVDTKIAVARRKAIAASHADASWVRARVDELPPEALAVAYLLTTRGGSLRRAQLAELAREHFAMTDGDLERGLTSLARELLAVALAEYGVPSITLVAPSARHLVNALEGVDVPPLPSLPFVAAERVDHRTFLAICTAVAHAEVKVTRSGDPHLATTKRLAKQVGVDEEVVSRGLAWGERLRLVYAADQRLCCDPQMLRSIASGSYEHDPVLAAIGVALRTAPAPLRDVERWIHASTAECLCENVGLLPHVETGTVGDDVAASWYAPEGAAASYVTPSFEVFVPPEARLIDVVEVGLCAAWTRLDTVLVARISRTSVVNAVRLGATGPAIVAALSGLSRHAVPQNVEVAILDWASSIAAATVASGTIITIDPTATDQALRALRSHGARQLAPGIVFVESDGDRDPEVERALKAADILLPSRAASRPAALRHATGAPVVLPGPSEAVRRRFAEWQEARPPVPAPAAPPRKSPPPAGEITRKSLDILRKLFAGDRRYEVLDDDLDDLDLELDDVDDDDDDDEPPWRVRVWHADNILVRLNNAALAKEAIAVRWGGDELPVRVHDVVKRGTTWLLLGEDLGTRESIAIRVPEIKACGELVVGDTSLPSPPAAAATAPIAGHLPCPCGSGKRYRACCRAPRS